jgi:hypothetical protein
MKSRNIATAVLLTWAILAIASASEAQQAAPPPATGESAALLAFPGLNLNGDVFYFLRTGTFGAGATFTVAMLYDGLGELKIAWVKPVNAPTEPDRYGAGLGVNLPKLVEKLGGQWAAKGINSSVGLMGLVPVGGSAGAIPPTVEWAIYATIVRVNF